MNLSSTSPIGTTQYDITGGTRTGTNLFHSFGKFSVPTNTIANFFNDSGLETSNIVGRVTGGNPSSIFGTIQTTSFGNANLFLMNPSGIVFGPNASLNVGGSVTFTTANYLRLAETNGATGVFHADPAIPSVLTSAAVAAYGFLGSNSAGIAVEGSTLRVEPGSSISLVSGNQGFSYINPDTSSSIIVPNGISIATGQLTAVGGQVNIASVASTGEVSANDFRPTAGMAMGQIDLSREAKLDVSDNSAGTVRIRGGQLIITDSTISADTNNTNGAATAIDINIAGDLTVTGTRGGPTITARTIGSGNSGEVRISSSDLNIISTSDSPFTFIDTHTAASGKAGNVTITATRNLTAEGGLSNSMYLVDSGVAPSAEGIGGNVTIAAGKVELTRSSINTGDFIAQQEGENSLGAGGNIFVTTDTLHITNSVIATDSSGSGRAGGFTIFARDVQISDFSLLQQLGMNGTGKFLINTTNLLMRDSAQIISGSALAPGGGVDIIANTVELKNGSTIQSQTFGNGPAGDIRISAFNHVTLSDDPATLGAKIRPSGLFSNSVGGLGNLGNAGTIVVTSPKLKMSNGARIDTTTQTGGQGGDATIIAKDTILISGERPTPVEEIELFGLGSSRPSGIFTRTVGQTPDSGSGGNITLIAGRSISIKDGSSVSASSSGPGNAGSISINAGRQLDVRNGSITTKADHASGGNIDIRAIDRIRFANSTVSASVGADSGNGGNITIDPNVVVLQKSQILAQAVQGHGGNITITTPLFLADPRSLVDASSQFGVSGTVTIQSPISNLSGTVKQLTSKPSETQSLLQNRCAALAGGDQSTFILAGRDVLPSEPGGWLSSPLVMGNGAGHGHEDQSRLTGKRMVEGKMLSLRRLTPPGFLVRSFANGPTGCHS